MMRGALAVLGQMAVAVVVAAIVAVVSLVAISGWSGGLQLVQPAARADHRRPVRLSGRAARIRLAVAARRRRRARAALVFLSAFSVVTLAMPLGATKLYLFGISVDQQFRPST
jgi:galactan 5-O-arabinofuranosyltransferase